MRTTAQRTSKCDFLEVIASPTVHKDNDHDIAKQAEAIMEELEKHLRGLCTGDSRLRLLEAQWEYDKRLVQQALQTIGGTFPHYSLHDTSHSNTILLNIARVLGERIAELSATDTWLLLESAYWHDVGMVVSDASMREAWSTPEFKDHLIDLANSDDGLLAHAARVVSSQSSIASLGESWPIEIKNLLTLVVADFFRRRHPSRSADAIRHPGGFSIESPRTLIPARLFEWLARVCLAHGQSVSAVMNLPKVETGVGNDKCHPRFVAFMLRLGDLLDLDNGRFCPTLLASVGRVPVSSTDHIGKHASIEHFYVGPDIIEVEAVCTSGTAFGKEFDAYGSYQAISEWLNWLKSELTHLAVSWSAIAPKEIRGAPSIGKISARLSGYELVGDRTAPKFDVDSDYFLGLSKSSGLFGAPHEAWQRELITNAVDATLIQIWRTAPPKVRETLQSCADPFEVVRDLSKDMAIEVSLEPTTEFSPDFTQRRWRVEITDRGTGFGPEDIRALQVVGSSTRNSGKKAIVREMPLELKPTGSFGLGFQSVFLDTHEVEIRTIHATTSEARRILLRRPSLDSVDSTSAMRAGVYIQKELRPEPLIPGTKIAFDVMRPARFGLEQDVVLPTESMPTVDNWIEQLALLCGTLPVPVRVNGRNLSQYHEKTNEFAFFDREQAMRISLGGANEKGHYVVRKAYRGAQIAVSEAKLISSTVDLYTGHASKFLQVNRSALTTDGELEFEQRQARALPKALTGFLTKLRKANNDQELLKRASLLARGMGIESGDEWKDINCVRRVNSQNLMTIGELLSNEAVVLLTLDGRHIPRPLTQSKPIPSDSYILDGSIQDDAIWASLIRGFSTVRILDVVGPIQTNITPSYVIVYEFSRLQNDEDVVSNEALEFFCVPRYPGRDTLPCATRFNALSIHPQGPSRTSIPEMLSPYVAHGEYFDAQLRIRCDNPLAYVRHVFANRARQNQSELREIIESTKQYLRFADKQLRECPWLVCEYDLRSLETDYDRFLSDSHH